MDRDQSSTAAEPLCLEASPRTVAIRPKALARVCGRNRALAEQLTDTVARENMLEVARAYDRMAARAEDHPILKDPRKDSI